MTPSLEPTRAGAAAAQTGPRHPGRGLAAAQLLAMMAAAALCVLTYAATSWDLDYLVILVILAVVSEFTATALPSGSFSITGSFLGIMLTAVLLGGAAAAVVGVITAVVGWWRWRENTAAFRHNVAAFAWFPLLSGLWFHWIVDVVGVRLRGPNYAHYPAAYFLLVFVTFLVGLALNFAMNAGYICWRDRLGLMRKLAEFRPIISAELATAVLTLIAVYLTNRLHVWGLLMFALVLLIYQYLIGELLLSQHRGAELAKLAHTDELTGLANRKRFNERVDELIADGRAAGRGAFGVLLLDLDHFKDVNDTLGHQYGDDLLAELGPRLETRIGEGGLVARFGGDEFGVLPAVRTENMASLTAIAEDVIACLREPVCFDEVTLQVDASIGVARYPSDGTDAQTLLRRADIAMYEAKAERAGHRFYTHGQDRHSVSRLSMVGDFRRALGTDDEIVVHFHPIVDLGVNRVHGAEALVRWQHPELGLLQPAAFLEIVEQTGLIGPMTDHVLRRAIAECAAWHAAGRDLTVAVNLSVRNLHDPMLSSQVAQLLDHHRLAPESLMLEITESMILSDPQRALVTIGSLSEIGVRFAVDDFGTGHSTLANLRTLPVHELKIDRSFVTPMLNEESDGVIVRSTVDLGHALGLKVVAEGVEDAVTLARLAEIGCDRAQGHYFAKPIPPIEFMRWIGRFERDFRAAA